MVRNVSAAFVIAEAVEAMHDETPLVDPAAQAEHERATEIPCPFCSHLDGWAMPWVTVCCDWCSGDFDDVARGVVSLADLRWKAERIHAFWGTSGSREDVVDRYLDEIRGEAATALAAVAAHAQSSVVVAAAA